MRIEGFNNRLVEADITIDRIPGLSTLSNLVDLCGKIVIHNNKNINIDENSYFSHLHKKSFKRCLILLIPVIGNVIISIDDWMMNFVKNAPRLRMQTAPAVCKAINFCVAEDKKSNAHLAELKRKMAAFDAQMNAFKEELKAHKQKREAKNKKKL